MSALEPSDLGTPFDVITAVRRTNKILRARFDDALYEFGLSYAQYEALLLLRYDGNLHASALARDLRISRQAAGRLVYKLLAGGLVEMLPRDRGVIGLRITDEGIARLRLVRTALSDTDRRLAALPHELRARLVEDLGSVERALARPLDGNYW
jgi:DNA-binding MarR family transcriptional regulator